MPLTFLLDEHLRGTLRSAIERHNERGFDPIDATCVGDPPDLPLGASDPAILIWAEQRNRLLVTHDTNTMIRHWSNHLQTGRHSPGLLLVRRGALRRDIVSFLAIAAHAGTLDDFRDQIEYIA
jgi:hypothetical protein